MAKTFEIVNHKGETLSYELPEVVIKNDSKDLIERIKRVKLRGQDILPYAKAHITVRPIYDMCKVHPPQMYVLRDNIKVLAELRKHILETYHYDMLELEGWLELVYEGGQHKAILPPIIEYCEGIPLVADGMHRMYLAELTMCTPLAVVINNVPVEYPYYAYPVNRAWKDIDMIDELTPSTIKKFHRSTNYKAMYRDFNTAFPYVGESRPVQK